MKKNLVSEYKNLIFFTQIGMSVISPILLCVGIGWLLRRFWDFPSYGMVILILLGLASGLHSAWRVIKRMLRNTEETENRKKEEGHDGQ